MMANYFFTKYKRGRRFCQFWSMKSCMLLQEMRITAPTLSGGPEVLNMHKVLQAPHWNLWILKVEIVIKLNHWLTFSRFDTREIARADYKEDMPKTKITSTTTCVWFFHFSIISIKRKERQIHMCYWTDMHAPPKTCCVTKTDAALSSESVCSRNRRPRWK